MHFVTDVINMLSVIQKSLWTILACCNWIPWMCQFPIGTMHWLCVIPISYCNVLPVKLGVNLDFMLDTKFENLKSSSVYQQFFTYLMSMWFLFHHLLIFKLPCKYLATSNCSEMIIAECSALVLPSHLYFAFFIFQIWLDMLLLSHQRKHQIETTSILIFSCKLMKRHAKKSEWWKIPKSSEVSSWRNWKSNFTYQNYF